MGYASDSSRIQRAATVSTRYTPRLVVALLGARVRAAGAWLAECWRAFAPATRAEAAVGVQTQRERSAQPAQVSAAPAGISLEIAVDTTEAMLGLAQASSAVQRLREQRPGSRSTARFGGLLAKQSRRITSTGDRRVTSTGDVRIVHQL